MHAHERMSYNIMSCWVCMCMCMDQMCAWRIAGSFLGLYSGRMWPGRLAEDIYRGLEWECEAHDSQVDVEFTRAWYRGGGTQGDAAVLDATDDVGNATRHICDCR